MNWRRSGKQGLRHGSCGRLLTLGAFFRGKRVFLTGHTGFKGAWLMVWLSQMGAEVKGYSLAPESTPSLYVGLNGDQYCQSVIADIRDGARLSKEMIDYKPDIVFHLAAQPLVRRSYLQPVDTWSSNVMGTVNVLEAMRQLTHPCIGVLITTDKVYQNQNTGHLYNETDRLGGHDPYSASKAACELVIDSYRNSYFSVPGESLIAIASARAGNVIGGGDWAEDRLIPDLIRAFSTNQPLKIRNPNSVRPWQHVLEPLHGYLLLAASLATTPSHFTTAWNFGPLPQDHLDVNTMCQIARGVWGGGSIDIVQSDLNPHETELLQLDISKSMSGLGWHPKLDAHRAVQMTIEWYQSVFAGADVSAQCVVDINRYVSL